MFSVLVISPNRETRRRLFDKEAIRVGSLGLNDLKLVGVGVEAEHLAIKVHGPGQFRVTGLGKSARFSLNGSSLIRGIANSGDLIEVGDHFLVVEHESVDQKVDRGSLLAAARLVLGLAEHLIEDPPLRKALKRLLDILIELFGASRALVLSIDAEGQNTPRTIAMIGDWPAGEPPRVSRTLLEKLLRTRAPILIADVLGDPELKFAQSVSVTVRSMIAGPVILDESIVGILYIESPNRAPAFGEDERKFLDQICRFVAQLVKKSRESEELKLESRRLLELHQRETEESSSLEDIAGDSSGVRDVREQILQVSPTDVTCLILGESGTGKELVARAIHNASKRAGRPFVAVNCTALPDTLAESELFGHVAGAFSGALKERLGRFELAHSGTLFLDEVGDLSPEVQAKLLRALQERVVQRVGESVDRPVDVRIVAATNAPLSDRIRDGRFREDLYYRLGVFTIRVPPLRDRPDDVISLADRFIHQFSRSLGRAPLRLDPEARQLLIDHKWPGNIRELKNVVEQAVVRESGVDLGARSLGFALKETAIPGRSWATTMDDASTLEKYGASFELARSRFEIEHLQESLRRHRGDMKRVLEETGLTKPTFYRKCASLGIDPAEYRKS